MKTQRLGCNITKSCAVCPVTDLPKQYLIQKKWTDYLIQYTNFGFLLLNCAGVWNFRQVVLEPRVSPEHTWEYVDTVIVFAKNLNQRSLTPRWPLTPHLLRSYVWLYPRIIVSKSQENTSKYVDTVTFFAKTWSKGHWPLGDLWPHICQGHMCDSTQGSLCPSPMKIH